MKQFFFTCFAFTIMALTSIAETSGLKGKSIGITDSGMAAVAVRVMSTAADSISLLKSYTISPGSTTATVIDAKNQFYITKGIPDQNGKIYVQFNGAKYGMAPGHRYLFKDQHNEKRYFIYKGLEKGKFIFYIQAYEIIKVWNGTSAPTATDTTVTPKNFSISPGATSATIIDRMNQFYISNGTPDQHGRIAVRFNGGTQNMAPGARYSFNNEGSERKYFIYKGIEAGKFVFYIQDYPTPPDWAGTSGPYADTSFIQKNFSIKPGITSATLIDKYNQFFISNGTPDQHGRIAVRFNGSTQNMAPGAKYSFTGENDKRLYFVYKGVEEGQFMFYTQKYN